MYVRHCSLQAEHGGLRLDFVDFNSGVPPASPFAMSALPNFHPPKQNWAGRGTNRIKVNETKSQIFTGPGDPSGKLLAFDIIKTKDLSQYTA